MNRKSDKINLAIFSPKQNTYSETFIQAHKNLPFNIKFYYGGFLPTQLDRSQSLFKFSLKEKILLRLNKKFSLSEHALYFSLKREKIDCILAEYAPTACESLEVIKQLDIPLIVHFHGFDATNGETIEKYRNHYLAMFAYAKKLFVVSEKMKNDVVELGAAENKIEISACGPNIFFFENEPQFKTNQFLAVSRFVDIKGIIFSICAFNKVVEKFSDALLVLVGDGPTLESCKQLSTALGISQSVHFSGALKPEDIRGLMNDSLAFVQHSITLDGGVTEGAPVSIMEAQAAALPVISSASGGIPDLVIHNETGFLVKEKDINEMSDYMLMVLKDRTIAAKLGKSGRERIQQYFTQEKHLKQIEEAVLEAVSGVRDE